MPFEPHEIEWTTEKSKRLWDYYGSNPHYRATFFGYQVGPAVAKRMIASLKAPANARFLDFSCGQGDIIAACLPRLSGEQEMYATDFSATYVDAVNLRFASSPRFKGAKLATSFPTPFPAAHFDVVFATEVIEHLLDAELDGMLSECKRLLKPGGRVFFTTRNEEAYDADKTMCPDCGCIYHRWQHVRVWSAATLKARVEQAGFRTTAVTPVNWYGFAGMAISLIRRKRIDRPGLVYVGERAA